MTTPGVTASSLPIVSLDGSDEDIARQLREVCIEHGFFYLKDHGVPSSVLAAALEHSKAFFDLSLEEKLKTTKDELSRGYFRYQEESLNPKQQSEGDTKEGFLTGREVPMDHPDYDLSKLKGPNQWPDPHVLPEFRPVMEDYYDRLCDLGLRMARLLALSLELPKDFFDENCRDDPMACLKLLHYDGQRASDPGKGIFGCAPHSDYGILTFLLTDQPGFQVFSKSETWIDVALIPDAYVVTLGDMLGRWTNGLYRPTLHRVLTPTNGFDKTSCGRESSDRYSIPFFYEPQFDSEIKCVSTCCNDIDNPPKYPPISFGQYLYSKYLETHTDFRASVTKLEICLDDLVGADDSSTDGSTA